MSFPKPQSYPKPKVNSSNKNKLRKGVGERPLQGRVHGKPTDLPNPSRKANERFRNSLEDRYISPLRNSSLRAFLNGVEASNAKELRKTQLDWKRRRKSVVSTTNRKGIKKNQLKS